jgi:hypothetical protein
VPHERTTPAIWRTIVTRQQCDSAPRRVNARDD